jgi:biofilm PGA synthesis N-glycosyltransferase PgaC
VQQIKKRPNCFLIPMHNEEQVIVHTLNSLRLAKIQMSDVYLVDDGCTDNTLKKLREIRFADDHILSLSPNVGKSKALITLFTELKLGDKYNWVNILDADTRVSTNYMEELRKTLRHLPEGYVAVCSKVLSDRSVWNLFVAYRALDYCLSHRVYKAAQGHVGAITVIPGCGSTFSTEVFAKLCLTSDNTIITEDMDWTAELHQNNLGKIHYQDTLTVVTQDPNNTESYIKQMHRWFRGAWQVARKRKMWKILKSRVNAELGALLLEGIFYSVTFLISLGLFLLHKHMPLATFFVLLDLVIFYTWCFLSALVELDLRILLYSLVFYPIRILNCLIFLGSFFEIIIFRFDRRNKLNWNKVLRY